MVISLLRRLIAPKTGPAAYDAQTIAIMRRVLRRRGVAVDVGAHVGAILREMLRCAPEGRHFAFEPLPQCFGKLQKRYGERRGVELFQLALAEKAEATTFQHVVSRPTYSGLRRRRYERAEEIVSIDVQCARLDDVIPADVKIDFIKIDVEGGEHGVLLGGLQTLRRTRPVVVFEHGLGGADYYGVAPEQVFDLLIRDCGLSVSLMDRFLAGKPALERSELVDEFTSGRNFYFVAYPR